MWGYIQCVFYVFEGSKSKIIELSAQDETLDPGKHFAKYFPGNFSFIEFGLKMSTAPI